MEHELKLAVMLLLWQGGPREGGVLLQSVECRKCGKRGHTEAGCRGAYRFKRM